MQAVAILEKAGTGFPDLKKCIEAVETYNSGVSQLINSSLRAGEAIENIFAKKRWEEMGLTGFKALCKKTGWTRSNCYMLRNGWKMYVEFKECIPEGIRVAGAYAWAELYKVHEKRRRITLGKAIALAEQDNGEITGPLIQQLDKPELGSPQLKILSAIENLNVRQKAENLAIEKAKKEGRLKVTTTDCHEAIEEVSQSYDSSRQESIPNEQKMVPNRTGKGKKGKPTGKNYDELLETTQKIFAVNEELKEELQRMRSEMEKLTASYEERITLMQQELEKLRKGASQVA